MEKDQLAVSNDEPTANIDKKTEDFIRCGRIWVTAFIATNLTGVMAYLIWVQVHFGAHGREQVAMDSYNYIAPCLALLAILLSVNVIWLVGKLKKKRDQISLTQEDKNAYNTEIRALWLIMSIFCVTYLVRAVWELVFLKTDMPNYGIMFAAVPLGLFWDFMPLMIILVFHYQNFKQ